MSCERCGRQTPRTRCRKCARDARWSGDGESDESDADALLYQCTACEGEFETADPGACPHCGAWRRRYIGDMEVA